ncbi:hypothetical protein WJX84_008231 [Apatococcus fuscideae]|uniref:Expansin-like EG45 domain-containing protein n=1 Tax=Apatococcus fuscideae TaxID=2026836 RepID=A0AAW1TL13_9CHLO
MSSLPTGWRTGIATNYGGAQDGDSPYSPSYGTSIGSCGYGLLDKSQWPYWSVGALSSSNMFYSEGPINGCGQCFEVQCVNSGGQYAGRCNGNGGESVTIMVSDSCPECEADHLDLQALTYNQLGPMALGRMDIKYRRVNCKPPVNLMVDVDSSSGEGGWIRMTVKNAAGRASIKGVALKGSGSSSWTDLTNDWVFVQTGARWETGQQPTGSPFDMQVTQDDGQVEGTGTFQTSMQFKIVGNDDSADIVSNDGAPSHSSSSSSSSGPSSAPAPSSSPSSSGGCSSCPDTPPSSSYTCAQQKSFGQCSQSWMSGYCKQTCGKCSC